MKADWSKENLGALVQSCRSNRELLLTLGIKDAESNYKTLRKYLDKYDLDSSHFHNQNHRRGKVALNKRPIEDYLVENSTYPRTALKRRLIKEGFLTYSCSLCGNEGSWRGKKLTLRLDHINGVNNDHRVENLRLLCPNCDSQSEYYCGRGGIRYTRTV